MSAYLTLVRRELGMFFNSITGYAVIASVLLLLGWSFVDMLDKLNREEGLTVILVTHDVARAAQLTDSALILARGSAAYRSEGPTDPRGLERAYLAALEATP